MAVASRGKSRPLIIVAVILVATMVAGVIVYQIVTRPQKYDFSIGGSPFYVEAELNGPGTVVATPSQGALPDLEGIRPYGTPVHLEVQGGADVVEAKLTFPIDTAKLGLPSGADPMPYLNILTRGDATGGVWQWASPGTYDPDTRSLSVEVDHFSDWAVGVSADGVLKSDGPDESFLTKTLIGDLKDPECPTGNGLLVKPKFPVNNVHVTACMTRDPRSGNVTLQLANQTSVPYKVTPPPGLIVKPDVLTGLGDVYDLYMLSKLGDGSDPILRPESKLEFVGESLATVPFNHEMPIKLDAATYFDDIGAFALGNIAGFKSDPQVLSTYKEMIGNNPDFRKCLDGQAEQLDEAIRLNDETKFNEEFVKLLENCHAPAVNGLITATERKMGVKNVATRGLKWLGKRVNMFTTFKSVMNFTRESVQSQIGIAAAMAGGDIHSGAMVLRPIPEPKELGLALPGIVGRGQTATIGVQRWLLMPDACEPFDYSWFESDAQNSVHTAVGSYVWPKGGTMSAQLVQTTEQHSDKAFWYVDGLPRLDCIAGYGPGDVPDRFEYVGPSVGGDSSRLYRLHSDEAADADGYVLAMSSGRYILLITIKPDGGADNVLPKNIPQNLAGFFGFIDSIVPTDFAKG